MCVCVYVPQLIWYIHTLTHTHTRTHTGLAVSLMISPGAQLTPSDSRLSPIMHHISSPGSELIKVVGKRGRGDESWRRKRKRREEREGMKHIREGGREVEAGAVKRALIGHFFCHSDSS